MDSFELKSDNCYYLKEKNYKFKSSIALKITRLKFTKINFEQLKEKLLDFLRTVHVIYQKKRKKKKATCVFILRELHA